MSRRRRRLSRRHQWQAAALLITWAPAVALALLVNLAVAGAYAAGIVWFVAVALLDDGAS